MFAGAVVWLNRESGENPEPARGCKRLVCASKPLSVNRMGRSEAYYDASQKTCLQINTNLSFSRREKIR